VAAGHSAACIFAHLPTEQRPARAIDAAAANSVVATA
jgi:hypothetical protein